MDIERHTNGEQAALWNGSGGQAWVGAMVLLDQVFKPFEAMLAEAVAARAANRVLDVGCGTGSTTLAAARAPGARRACVGVDISAPMIDAARARAQRAGVAADFIVADAQVHAFGRASFDLIVSRFGVMFFDDPVAAFANLRRAASDGAGLYLLAWRGAQENPFMTTAERAAAPYLPAIPARVPDAPGQFAFADARRVRGILSASGWDGIDIRPVDAVCRFPAHELERYFTQLGPLGRALPAVDPHVRGELVEKVHAAFDPYVHGAEVRFDAACWIIDARATRRLVAPQEHAHD